MVMVGDFFRALIGLGSLDYLKEASDDVYQVIVKDPNDFDLTEIKEYFKVDLPGHLINLNLMGRPLKNKN